MKSFIIEMIDCMVWAVRLLNAFLERT